MTPVADPGLPGQSLPLPSALAVLGDAVHSRLGAANAAREVALGACRRTIRACGDSIRAVHRTEWERADALADAARVALVEAQEALRPFPALAASGPLHDAEKEYAEARLTGALIRRSRIPAPDDLGVSTPAWLNGLAEAASELRRHLLDRLREGNLSVGEELLGVMDEVYALLVTIDYPDAVTGGLRRTTDAFRAVLERTRGDLTTTALQTRLQTTIERRLPPPG